MYLFRVNISYSSYSAEIDINIFCYPRNRHYGTPIPTEMALRLANESNRLQPRRTCGNVETFHLFFGIRSGRGKDYGYLVGPLFENALDVHAIAYERVAV